MHHQDFSGDLPGTGTRKTAFHFRRGSSGGVAAGDDNPSQAGTSSPGLQHQPHQSQAAGAQVKKKSGFQITSVTSAVSNVSAATNAAVPPPAVFDNTSAHVASVGGGAGPSASAPNTQTHHTQTQTATGSRFRVVKLDTNSEPFRKGRWTCTEYYEKEVPQSATAEAPKAAEVVGESEAGSAGVGQGGPAIQPPHTLQPYQQPTQDFTTHSSIAHLVPPPPGTAFSAISAF
uniref:TSC22 domain family member 1 n=1 Tax=Mola mola TaxID=94237 RepID=A0A3Q4BEZ4_MOLML